MALASYVASRRSSILGDTLYALEDWGSEATYFDTVGSVLGERKAPVTDLGESMRAAMPTLQFASGLGVAQPGVFMQANPTSVPMFLTDRNGTILDTVAHLDPSAATVHIKRDRGGTFLANPFGPPVSGPVFSPDGRYMATISQYPRGALDPGEARIAVRHLDGAPAWETIVALKPVRYRRAVVDSVLDSVLKPLAGAVTRAEFLDAVEVPEYEYPVRGAVFDDSDDVWLMLGGEGGLEHSTWLAVDTAGRHLRRVTLPDRSYPVIIRGDTVVVIVRDQLDVQYVAELLAVREEKGGGG